VICVYNSFLDGVKCSAYCIVGNFCELNVLAFFTFEHQHDISTMGPKEEDEDKFCFSRKGGIGGGGWMHPKCADSMLHLGSSLEATWLALRGPFLSFLA